MQTKKKRGQQVKNSCFESSQLRGSRIAIEVYVTLLELGTRDCRVSSFSFILSLLLCSKPNTNPMKHPLQLIMNSTQDEFKYICSFVRYPLGQIVHHRSPATLPFSRPPALLNRHLLFQQTPWLQSSHIAWDKQSRQRLSYSTWGGVGVREEALSATGASLSEITGASLSGIVGASLFEIAGTPREVVSGARMGRKKMGDADGGERAEKLGKVVEIGRRFGSVVASESPQRRVTPVHRR